MANTQDLFIYLLDIDKFHYPQCLEGAYTSVLNTMYDANSLGNGATCGINEETKGTFRSGNEATKLENALKGAWKVPEYWNKSDNDIALTIGKLCLDNDGVVDDLKSILTKDNCKSGIFQLMSVTYVWICFLPRHTNLTDQRELVFCTLREVQKYLHLQMVVLRNSISVQELKILLRL